MCCRLQKLLLLYLLNLQHTLIPYLQGTFFRGQKSTTPHHISWIAWIFPYIGGIYLRLYGFNLYNFQNKCMATRQHRNKLQRPGAIWIHDTGCYVLFLFSDSREQRQSIGMLYMDFKNRMLRPFIWCLQRDYSMPYGVNLFFKRHGAILKIAALRLYYTRIIDLLPLDFKRSFCWASVLIPKNLK